MLTSLHDGNARLSSGQHSWTFTVEFDQGSCGTVYVGVSAATCSTVVDICKETCPEVWVFCKSHTFSKALHWDSGNRDGKKKQASEPYLRGGVEQNKNMSEDAKPYLSGEKCHRWQVAVLLDMDKGQLAFNCAEGELVPEDRWLRWIPPEKCAVGVVPCVHFNYDAIACVTISAYTPCCDD